MVICTSKGTFSIYSIFDNESYLATPIEQFIYKKNLDERGMNFEQRADNQIIVKADYSIQMFQPPYPIIGMFRELKLDSNTYEVYYNLRRDIYSKEHKFHENIV